MKIGSLFDGSGGFPLAASMHGITPVWASEVEPYPIAVTTSRFPNMKHLGDISKINGADIEPVDIISFGSPCQDLSVAGKRAGLKHEDNGDDETTRSGLFMEAVRIIKEMRKATDGKYPRFAIWENVPGAFSSNKGEDFRLVLEELIKVTEPNAVMPEVPQKGWSYADNYCGDGWSIAYRVFDAQYWGVPQRRRRIYLVADFRGECAQEVLFKCEGLRGNFTQSRESREDITPGAEGSVGANDCEGAIGFDRYNQCTTGSVAETLRTPRCGDNYPTVCYGVDVYNQSLAGDKAKTLNSAASDADHIPCAVYSVENHPADSRVNLDESGKVQTLTSRMGTGGGNVPMVMHPRDDKAYSINHQGGNVEQIIEEKVGTLTASMNSSGNNKLSVAYGIDQGASRDVGDLFIEECSKTITNGSCPGHHNGVVIAIDRAFFNQGQNARYELQTYEDGPTSSTLIATDYKEPQLVAYPDRTLQYIVRRLTPTECARLQGFPDKWGHPIKKDALTDDEYAFWHEVRNTHERIAKKKVGTYTKEQILKWYNKLHNDGSEYKMWGNGIALPNALYVMQGIVNVLEEEKIARSKWLDDLLRS